MKLAIISVAVVVLIASASAGAIFQDKQDGGMYE